MKTESEISEAVALGRADAQAQREPLWYRCGESYVSAESGRIGNPELGAAYVRGYVAAGQRK